MYYTKLFYFCLIYLLTINVIYSQEVNQVVVEEKTQSLATMKADFKKLQVDIAKTEKEIAELTTPKKMWNFGSFSSITLNQAQYNNWVAGGESSVAFILAQDLYLRYENKLSKVVWNTKFNGRIGYKTGDADFRKTTDLLNIFSNFSYKLIPKFAFASDFSLRTQFLQTLDYGAKSQPILSNLFAPAYINLGLGVKWTPFDWLSAYVSPFTGQFTLVLDDKVDPQSFGVDSVDKVKPELGWYVNVEAALPINKSIGLSARCILFSNYLALDVDNGVDVDIQIKADAKISKYFYASLFVNFKYDADARSKVVNETTGVTHYNNAGWQIFENIGIGFSYKLDKRL